MYSLIVLVLLAMVSTNARAETPASVIGQWRWGTINPVTYWDAQTGQYRGHGGGMSCTYVFDEVGTYKMYLLIQTNNSGWQKTIWTYEEGKAIWAGDQLTFTPTAGKYKVMDNRVKRDNYDRPMTDEELKKHGKTVKWVVEKRDGKTVLVTGTDGKNPETVFRREEEKVEKK